MIIFNTRITKKHGTLIDLVVSKFSLQTIVLDEEKITDHSTNNLNENCGIYKIIFFFICKFIYE